MAFTEEKIQELGITKEQADKIDGFYQADVIPTLKKEWDGKANTDAEGILTGVASSVKAKFGIELDREKGQKWAEYLEKYTETLLTTKLSSKEKELEDKLKNFKGSDDLKAKYEKDLADEKAKNDAILQKLAKLEPLEGIDEKYNSAVQELSGLKLSVSFNSVKPNFPETVNKYEADAKWNEFKNDVLSKNNIELIENVPYAIDKENPHKKVKLSDLLEANTSITELLKGRQQRGTGANPAGLKEVVGLPFQIPINATSDEITVAVRQHLLKELGSLTHKDYTSKFRELYTKAKSA